MYLIWFRVALYGCKNFILNGIIDETIYMMRPKVSDLQIKEIHSHITKKLCLFVEIFLLVPLIPTLFFNFSGLLLLRLVICLFIKLNNAFLFFLKIKYSINLWFLFFVFENGKETPTWGACKTGDRELSLAILWLLNVWFPWDVHYLYLFSFFFFFFYLTCNIIIFIFKLLIQKNINILLIQKNYQFTDLRVK